MGIYNLNIEDLVKYFGEMKNIEEVKNYKERHKTGVLAYDEELYNGCVFPCLKKKGIDLKQFTNEELEKNIPLFLDKYFDEYICNVMFDGVFSFVEEFAEDNEIKNFYIGNEKYYARFTDELLFLYEEDKELKVSKILSNHVLVDYKDEEKFIGVRDMTDIIIEYKEHSLRGKLEYVKKSTPKQEIHQRLDYKFSSWAWDVVNSNYESIIDLASSDPEAEVENIIDFVDKEEIVKWLKGEIQYEA